EGNLGDCKRVEELWHDGEPSKAKIHQQHSQQEALHSNACEDRSSPYLRDYKPTAKTNYFWRDKRDYQCKERSKRGVPRQKAKGRTPATPSRMITSASGPTCSTSHSAPATPALSQSVET